MMFGKKGTAGSQNWVPETVISYIILTFIVSLVAIFFAFSISNKASAKARIDEEVELLNLIQRFTDSPNCFIMSSDDVVANHIIDVNKFTEERLNNCYNVKNLDYLAFKLKLKSVSLYTVFEKEIRTSNWNDNRPFEKKKAPKQVLIFSEGKISNGELTIEIQNIRK